MENKTENKIKYVKKRIPENKLLKEELSDAYDLIYSLMRTLQDGVNIIISDEDLRPILDWQKKSHKLLNDIDLR